MFASKGKGSKKQLVPFGICFPSAPLQKKKVKALKAHAWHLSREPM